VTEAELRSLVTDPAPREAEAGERAWAVVQAAYGTRERVPWIERHSRAVLALAAAVALGVAAVSPPGRALVERVREAAGVTPSEPALVRLPSPGRLLVESPRGPWVVREDGSKRRLGDYGEASWSPRGLFVVAASDRRVVALEPDGDVRWTVTRPRQVADARWAPSGFRIAYREGDTLRVVVGDGTRDRRLARAVAPIAPAWLPDASRNVLAYVDAEGRIRVVDVDTGAELWSVPGPESPASLRWSPDDSRLLVISADGTSQVYDARGREVGGLGQMDSAAYSPGAGTLAYSTYDPATDSSTVWLVEDGREQALFTGVSRFQDLVWSPNGRWLLVTWPAADQWLFFRAPSVRGVVSVPGIAREFDPGGQGTLPFPRVSGWAPS
jgi:dipeptidyl aminopeptidase/acylaminoacyl peptidase